LLRAFHFCFAMPCNATAGCGSPLGGSSSEFLPVTTPSPTWKPREEHDAQAQRSPRWQRMLGDYRVAEFGCTLVMYLLAKSFTLMAVNDRAHLAVVWLDALAAADLCALDGQALFPRSRSA
jgi:hypothetical protein